MLRFTLFSLISSALAAPLFGIGADSSNGKATSVSFATINATLQRPAQFARAAYCSGATLKSWTCGLPCNELKGVTFLQSGGDEGEVPFYFIAHDSVEKSLVVAHEGTDTQKLLSILNDAEFALTGIDTKRISKASAQGIKVHDGFQATFQRTADGLLAGVKTNLAKFGVSKVVVTGHSLGGALALMTAAMLRSNLPASVQVTTTVFAPPRGGNSAYANFLDSTLKPIFVTNQKDPVPIVPPLIFGFQHSGGEVFIKDSTLKNIISCPGHDDNQCITGHNLATSTLANHFGPYFNGITFGRGQCSS